MNDKNHFKLISTILFLIICIIYFVTNCKSKIFNKPIWPCPYNQSRLKNLYVKESSGKYTSQSLFDIYSFTHVSHGIILFYVYITVETHCRIPYMNTITHAFM